MGELDQTELGTITPDWKSRETEIGLIPESWDVVPLGDVLTMAQYGLSLKGEKSGPYGLLRMTNQVDGKISTCNLQYVSISESDFSKYSVERGDLLFNRTNSFELVGRSAIFDIVGDYVFASYLIRLRTNAEGIDPYFLNYYLSADETQARLKSIATRSVSQSNISASRLRGFPVPLPSISEQKKIAYVLSAVQRAIEQQHRIIALTTELKKALMHKLFTEGLRGGPKKETEIGLMPESWGVVKIGDLFKFTSGKTRPSDVESVPSDLRPYPIYGGNGVLGYSSMFLLDRSVLVLGRVGEYCGCAHHTDGPAWISDNALYTKKVSQDIDTHYAMEYFNYANLNQYSNKMGQPLITQGIICALNMPLPSLSEQQAILEPLTALNVKLDLHNKRSNLLQELLRTLLHQLMTAQIRVNDLDIGELETDIME